MADFFTNRRQANWARYYLFHITSLFHNFTLSPIIDHLLVYHCHVNNTISKVRVDPARPMTLCVKEKIKRNDNVTSLCLGNACMVGYTRHPSLVFTSIRSCSFASHKLTLLGVWRKNNILATRLELRIFW